jgi:hypothetical protein
MNYCPFISFGHQYVSEVPCMGEDCILWDSNKDNCLIRLALLNYTHDVPAEKRITREDELEAQIKILKQQLQAVSMGFPIMNFGNTIDKDYSGLQGGL